VGFTRCHEVFESNPVRRHTLTNPPTHPCGCEVDSVSSQKRPNLASQPVAKLTVRCCNRQLAGGPGTTHSSRAPNQPVGHPVEVRPLTKRGALLVNGQHTHTHTHTPLDDALDGSDANGGGGGRWGIGSGGRLAGLLPPVEQRVAQPRGLEKAPIARPRAGPAPFGTEAEAFPTISAPFGNRHRPCMVAHGGGHAGHMVRRFSLV